MTSDEYQIAIAQLGLDHKGAARWLGLSVRSSQYYAGGGPIPEPLAILLRLCVKLKLSRQKGNLPK